MLERAQDRADVGLRRERRAAEDLRRERGASLPKKGVQFDEPLF